MVTWWIWIWLLGKYSYMGYLVNMDTWILGMNVDIRGRVWIHEGEYGEYGEYRYSIVNMVNMGAWRWMQ
jgi:hypothetical protein